MIYDRDGSVGIYTIIIMSVRMYMEEVLTMIFFVLNPYAAAERKYKKKNENVTGGTFVSYYNYTYDDECMCVMYTAKLCGRRRIYVYNIIADRGSTIND